MLGAIEGYREAMRRLRDERLKPVHLRYWPNHIKSKGATMVLDDLTRFEIRASVFYKVKGKLAPGKDWPAALGPRPETLLAEWDEWNRQNGKLLKMVLDAVEEHVAD